MRGKGIFCINLPLWNRRYIEDISIPYRNNIDYHQTEPKWVISSPSAWRAPDYNQWLKIQIELQKWRSGPNGSRPYIYLKRVSIPINISGSQDRLLRYQKRRDKARLLLPFHSNSSLTQPSSSHQWSDLTLPPLRYSSHQPTSSLATYPLLLSLTTPTFLHTGPSRALYKLEPLLPPFGQSLPIDKIWNFLPYISIYIYI